MTPRVFIAITEDLDLPPELATPAMQVLKLIANDPSAKVTPYENGRERGYTVRKGGKLVAFAEYRSSDDIVVYRGQPNAEWDTQSEPDLTQFADEDSVYRTKKFFSSDKMADAAAFIGAYLGLQRGR
jgi:hypothetical protein